MKLKIDQEKCIGCGSCQAICPDVFELGEDNKAHLKDEQSDKKCVQEAVEICPTQAIEIKE